MTWTAKLTDFENRLGIWFAAIDYIDSNKIKSFSKNYQFDRITKKQLRRVARNEIARLVDTDTTDVNIPIGSTIDITPEVVIPPTPPTQAQIDRDVWFTDWDQLQKMNKLFTEIPAMATPAMQATVTGLQSSLKAGWKNSYLARM